MSRTDRTTPVRPQRIRRAKRAQPQQDRSKLLRQRVGWTLAVVGLLLFLSGSIGARLGVVVLPFDPHHVIGQLGGAVFGVFGVVLATRDG